MPASLPHISPHPAPVHFAFCPSSRSSVSIRATFTNSFSPSQATENPAWAITLSETTRRGGEGRARRKGSSGLKVLLKSIWQGCAAHSRSPPSRLRAPFGAQGDPSHASTGDVPTGASSQHCHTPIRTRLWQEKWSRAPQRAPGLILTSQQGRCRCARGALSPTPADAPGGFWGQKYPAAANREHSQ